MPLKPLEGVVSFSDYFGIDPDRLEILGAFDPLLGTDLPFAIDPKLLEESETPEITGAYNDILTRFRDVMALLEGSRLPDDIAWRRAVALLHFPEFQGPYLGFARTGVGHGWGPVLQRQVATTAKQIIELGIRDPHLFELLGVFEDGIGPDLISDMIGTLLRPRLCQFTKRVCDDVRVATESFTIDGTEYDLPAYAADNGRKRYVILIPQDILSEMPIALDRSDVPRVAALNEYTRQHLNLRFGVDWRDIVLRRKDVAREALLTRIDVLSEFISRYEQRHAAPYDFSDDPNNQRLWYDFARAFLGASPTLALQLSAAPTDTAVLAVVHRIISEFKKNVEHNGLWQLFYNDDGTSRREAIIQRAFQAVAHAYCESNGLDLSPETNSGRGPVDFKFSHGARRVLVELKRSSNSRLLHGYKAQLAAYEAAEGVSRSIYVIIDQGDSDNAVASVVAARNEAIGKRKSLPDLVIIEAWRHAAGSRA